MLLALLLASTTPTVEELEQKDKWTEQDRVAAIALASVRETDWSRCVISSRAKLIKKRAEAETIATAVLGSCLDQQEQYRRALEISFRGVMEPGARTTSANRVIEKRRDNVREETIAAVLNAQ